MASTTANQQVNAKPASPGVVKRIVVILLIVLVAAGAAGAATWFFMSKQAPTATAAAPAPVPAPIFFPLESMTVNLQGDDGQQHYLRIGLTLKLADQKSQEHLTEHMPEVRSRVLLALSNKHPEELSTLDGKHALAKELAGLIEKPTEANGQPAHVDDVLFTEFVVQ